MKSIRDNARELVQKEQRVARWEKFRDISDDELFINYADEELWINEGGVFE